MSIPAPRITEPRFWLLKRADHRIRGLKAERRISYSQLEHELAEIASDLGAEANQMDRVIAAYRQEKGLTSEQVRAKHRSRPAWPRW